MTSRRHIAAATLAALDADLLPELTELHRLAAEAGAAVSLRTACDVDCGERRFPVPVLTLGTTAADAPAVGFFGGVHGLERIGAEVVIAYLRSLVMRLPGTSCCTGSSRRCASCSCRWSIRAALWRGTRANPNGVDLMRNAPVDATRARALPDRRPAHQRARCRGTAAPPARRWSARAQALCRVVEDRAAGRGRSASRSTATRASACATASGSRTRTPRGRSSTCRRCTRCARSSTRRLLHHRYVRRAAEPPVPGARRPVGPPLPRACRAPARRVFLPLTLEMGSWLWVKKNPRQLFSRHGIFNPLIEHRQQRVLRHAHRVARLHRARRGQPRTLAAARRAARGAPRAGAGALVPQEPGELEEDHGRRARPR